ncbi:hypothetical protein EDB86DRAFT_2140339 [Lactarius hatsudake]|nr:hypothetical protein EDB86DRAFT_2140339 [Lactarius hatsudake]
MLYKRRCNAGKRGRRGREEKEEEERRIESEEKGMAWGDRPGRIDRGSYTLTHRHPTRRDLPIPPNLASVTPPILHSPFPRHTSTDRDPSIHTPPSQLNFFSAPSHSLFFPPLFLSHSLATFLSSSSSSDAPHCYLILSVPFPHHILAPFPLTNPTCMRLFPHVVLIIYTFSISRLFFFSSLPIRQARLSSQPLIHLYARRCVRRFPVCLTLSLSFTPSELDPAKTSLSARLAGFSSSSRQSAKKNITFTFFGGEWK